MHELSLALGMASELTRLARENSAKKVITVNLKIGKMSGVVIDSLKFAFDVIKTEHPLLSSTEILIEEVPLRYECMDCKSTFSPQDNSAVASTIEEIYFPSCPTCKSHHLKLISGEEMNIENLEVEV